MAEATMPQGHKNASARVHRSALQFHNARLFVAGQALSNIGTFSQFVALSLLGVMPATYLAAFVVLRLSRRTICATTR